MDTLCDISVTKSQEDKTICNTMIYYKSPLNASFRFSQFSGCWLILSVYIIMSFEFPFGMIVRSSVILLLPLFIIEELKRNAKDEKHQSSLYY